MNKVVVDTKMKKCKILVYEFLRGLKVSLPVALKHYRSTSVVMTDHHNTAMHNVFSSSAIFSIISCIEIGCEVTRAEKSRVDGAILCGSKPRTREPCSRAGRGRWRPYAWRRWSLRWFIRARECVYFLIRTACNNYAHPVSTTLSQTQKHCSIFPTFTTA